jgi:hypothetical protein
MKLSISDVDLVQLLRDRIDDADADTLCLFAECILGVDVGAVSCNYLASGSIVDEALYTIDTGKSTPEELGFGEDGKMLSRYSIKEVV